MTQTKKQFEKNNLPPSEKAQQAAERAATLRQKSKILLERSSARISQAQQLQARFMGHEPASK